MPLNCAPTHGIRPSADGLGTAKLRATILFAYNPMHRGRHIRPHRSPEHVQHARLACVGMASSANVSNSLCSGDGGGARRRSTAAAAGCCMCCFLAECQSGATAGPPAQGAERLPEPATCARARPACLRVSNGNAPGNADNIVRGKEGGGGVIRHRLSLYARPTLACSCTVLKSKSRGLPPSESLSAAYGNIASQCHPAGLSLVGCRSWPYVTLGGLHFHYTRVQTGREIIASGEHVTMDLCAVVKGATAKSENNYSAYEPALEQCACLCVGTSMSEKTTYKYCNHDAGCCATPAPR